MSRLFDRGSSEFLEVDSTPITAPPFTMTAWFRPGDTVSNQTIVFIGDKDSTDNFWALYAGGSRSGDPVTMIALAGGSTLTDTSTGWTVGTWHHAAGVVAAANDRRVYIDGGSKVTSSVSRSPSGIDRISVGHSGDSSPSTPYSGRIAEVAIWDVALTDAEILILANRAKVLSVRPANLKGYWPIFGVNSPEVDYSGQGNHLTVTGAVIADHVPLSSQFGISEGLPGGAAPAVVSRATILMGGVLVR